MIAFPFARLGVAEHGGALPASADVVVIGGGIAGVTTAWELVGQGLRVVVCEKGRIGAEQSGRNWGWIRAQGRDPAEIPLVIEARRKWVDWSRRLGPALGHRISGVTYLAKTEAEFAEYDAWMVHARAHGLDTRLLSAAQTARQMQVAPGTWVGAQYTPSDGRAEPWVAVPMIARAVAQAGVTIREGCAVRALDIEAGRVTGVITEAGRIRCDAVVLAGGAWSSLFLRAHGVRLPQLAVLSSVAATAAMPAGFDGAAADTEIALRRRADGGFTLAPGSSQAVSLGPDALRHLRAFWPVLRKSWRTTKLRPFAPRGFPDGWTTPRHWSPDTPSPFEALRILNPTPDRATIDRFCEAFARAFPALGRPKLASTWAGMIDTMPDIVPVLDTIPALPGLVVGTGLSGHGFGIGPEIGRVLAALTTGTPSGHDLTRFRFGRFSDGSGAALGPAL